MSKTGSLLSQNGKKKKGISRCKSIVNMLDEFPIIVTPTKNIPLPGGVEPWKKSSEPIEPLEKNIGVGPDFPEQANGSKPPPLIKSFQKPVKTNFHLFPEEDLESLMEECPLVLHKRPAFRSWPEYVEDWSGALKGTHKIVAMEPLYQ